MPALLLQDTSVLINLLATDRFNEIATSTRWQFAICNAVHGEAKSIWNPETQRREDISLLPYINSGLLMSLDLDTDEEREAYIELCSLQGLGEGEAMCIALARSRQIEFATDDRKAIRVFISDQPSITPISTPAILMDWQLRMALPDVEMGMLLTRIESCAKFMPGLHHPHFAWWQAQKKAFTP